MTPPELYGYVVRYSGKDTLMAVSARVWTEPASDVATTSDKGYWGISNGLVPGKYRVLAEYEGVVGRSGIVTTELGKTDTVFVEIGNTETRWPPPDTFFRLLPRITRGGGIIR